tara:strand:- start:1322 stop:1507 length:186 start_codon:yes stop_codon:yes gene_type:complete
MKFVLAFVSIVIISVICLVKSNVSSGQMMAILLSSYLVMLLLAASIALWRGGLIAKKLGIY